MWVYFEQKSDIYSLCKTREKVKLVKCVKMNKRKTVLNTAHAQIKWAVPKTPKSDMNAASFAPGQACTTYCLEKIIYFNMIKNSGELRLIDQGPIL